MKIIYDVIHNVMGHDIKIVIYLNVVLKLLYDR